MGFGSLGAIGAGANGGSAVPAVLQDFVPPRNSADAAYGLIKLGYSENCIELRNKQSGSYVTKRIGFSLVGGRWQVNVAEGDAFDALRDPSTMTEVRFLDQFGNGNDTSIAGGHLGFFWGRDVYGNPVLQSVHAATNTSNTSQALAIPSTVALNNDAYTALFVGSVDSAWPQSAIHIYELSNPRTRFFSFGNGGGYGFAFGNSGTFAYSTQQAGPGFFANVISPNQIQAIFNDKTISAAKPLQSGVSAGGNLGWSTNGFTAGGGANYLAMLFYNRTLTPTELGLARAWAYQNYNTIVQPSAISNLIIVGESVGEGFATISNQCFPQLMLPLLRKKVNLFVAATSGFSYTNWMSNLSAVTGLLQPGMENIVVLFGCCWNEIVQGAAPAQAYANMQSLVSSWRSAASNIGASVKVVGTGQQQVANGTIPTATQNSFWSLLEAGHSFLDGFYDLWNDPFIGSAGNVSNAVYYVGDHLTAPVAHQIVAEGLATVVNAVAN